MESIKNEVQFSLSGLTVADCDSESLHIEGGLLEEDGCAGTEDVVIVGYEGIAGVTLCEATQVVIVEHCLP